ncbi:MAG: thioredoxin family protein [Leptospiraceae bacterium]|nr:thioredoxin family protein [Leptospiraceae bacterium]
MNLQKDGFMMLLCRRLGRFLTVGFLLAIAFRMEAETLGPVRNSHSRARLHTALPENTKSGGNIILLEIELDPGWHTYWINPGDSGAALQANWRLPAGATEPEILWPPPIRIASGPLMTYGYEGRVFFGFLFEGSAPPEAFGLELEWLECADICIPAKARFQRDSSTATQNRMKERRPDLLRALQSLNRESPRHLLALTDGQYLELKSLATSQPLRAEYAFFEDELLVEHAAPQTSRADRIRVPLQAGAQIPDEVRGLLKSGEQYYSFVATVTRVDDLDESMLMLELLTFSGLAFLGGIILNLMPCVLPVLSLKIFHLMSLSGESRKKLFLYTGSYSAGVILSFLALSGLLIALRAAGEQLGWGFHLQSSGFLVFMILFLSVFALNLLGVFEIGLSLTSISAPEIRTDHGLRAVGSAFLSGILATVVASPCTAPFMGSAIGFALSRSAFITLTVFFFLGLGLAFPFLLAGVFPSVLKVFPRPGAWMVRFKQLLAFPLLATVAWLLWVLGNQTSVDGMTLGLFAVILLAVAAYLYGSFVQPFSHKISTYIASVIAVFFLVVATFAAYLASSSSSEATPRISHTGTELPEYTPGQWIDFDPALVQKFREAGVPVFVDFTADWCLSCKVNEKTVLSTDRVQTLFRRGNVATFKADWTEEDPVISRELERLGRNGVPTYALYIPGESEARLLPELLTVDIMEKALSTLANASEGEPEENKDSKGVPE